MSPELQAVLDNVRAAGADLKAQGVQLAHTDLLPACRNPSTRREMETTLAAFDETFDFFRQLEAAAAEARQDATRARKRIADALLKTSKIASMLG